MGTHSALTVGVTLCSIASRVGVPEKHACMHPHTHTPRPTQDLPKESATMRHMDCICHFFTPSMLMPTKTLESVALFQPQIG